jgi:hypothetical protein
VKKLALPKLILFCSNGVTWLERVECMREMGNVDNIFVGKPCEGGGLNVIRDININPLNPELNPIC